MNLKNPSTLKFILKIIITTNYLNSGLKKILGSNLLLTLKSNLNNLQELNLKVC